MSARDDYPDLAAMEAGRMFPDASPHPATAALDEIDRLRRWKEEAMMVSDLWVKVWVAAGKPGRLGDSIAEATLSRVKAWAEMLPVPS